MKNKWKVLALCIAVPLIVGGLAALLSSSSMEMFDSLNKPPLAPPSWLFPVAWTILYILMGISSYLVLTSGAKQEAVTNSLKFYCVQLIFNFLWTIFFFNLKSYWFSFVWLVILWALILITSYKFSKISKLSAYLLVPYILWVIFAGYLNFAIATLN